jgi:hypothetical protein
MRKLTFLVFAFLFVSSLSFAQEASVPEKSTSVAPAPVVSAPVPVSQTVQAPSLTKAVTGKVDSITIGDIAQGTKSELIVVAEDGQKLSFVVKNGTPVIDKDAKNITLSDLKKDFKVTVNYTMKVTGTNRAQSIKLLE